MAARATSAFVGGGISSMESEYPTFPEDQGRVLDVEAVGPKT
jgi:hypothetical protein